MKYSGGFYIVEEIEPLDWMDRTVLPNKLFKPTQCFCRLFPDETCLSWTSVDDADRVDVQQWLGVNEDDFKRLIEEVDKQFNDEVIGWIGNIINESVAIDYVNKYLSTRRNIRLIELSTDEVSAKEFLEEFEPNEGNGYVGVHLALKKGQHPSSKGISLGFDLLGYDTCGFHSFVCNSLEKEFAKQSLLLNEFALFSSKSDAEKALEFINNNENVAEPALWQIWEVSEIPVSG